MTSSPIKRCKSNQYRSKSGRCVKGVPCGPGRRRSPKTHRCRKIKSGPKRLVSHKQKSPRRRKSKSKKKSSSKKAGALVKV